jgi:hypothetical protein
MSDKFEPSASMTVAPTQALGVLSSSEQQRAIAEVQAAMILARANPRDQIRALDLIRQDCTRPTLAERALYTYARGGSDITGPSIRLAECMAMRWGNIAYGTRELEQREGESLMQAYAWDMEVNLKREMIFTVPHVRESKNKGQVLVEGARDIYEVTANMGARRLRACILGVIPSDIVEAAVEQVEETLKTKADVTPVRVQKMLELFASYGVTKEQIEKRIQRRATVESLTPALLLQLGKIANSLRDGMSAAADWFEVAGVEPPAAKKEPGDLLVSDVLAAATAVGWTQKQLLEFVRDRFNKELTALERGQDCATAIAAITAQVAALDAEKKKAEADENARIDAEAAAAVQAGALPLPSPAPSRKK